MSSSDDAAPDGTDSRPSERILRSRHGRETAARLDVTLARLGLVSEAAPPSPLVPLAVRTLGLAIPESITEREQRLIRLAGEASKVALEPQGHAFRDHAVLYMALLCCSWAEQPSHLPEARTVALVAATSLAALASDNRRTLMGVSAALSDLAAIEDLDAGVRECALRVGSEDEPSHPVLAGTLAPVVTRLEGRLLG